MHADVPFDDALAQRLPLPLAQLYRRAHDAAQVMERHLAAFYLWEAGLKLLACVAVVEYAAREAHDPAVAERLQNLARPSLGHWREFVRLLVPLLASQGDALSPRCTAPLTSGRATTCPPRPAWTPCSARIWRAGQGPVRPSGSASCSTGW
jgi:hypothetical protein